MAVVEVEIRGPAFEPETMTAVLTEAARVGMDATIPGELTRIIAAGKVPTNLGTLRRAVAQAAQPARVEDGTVIADIAFTGEAAVYGPVMDLGRRPAKMSWRFLYYAPGRIGDREAWRGGWVYRARRDWVREVAASLESQDAAQPRTSTRTTRRTKRSAKARREAYERRAAYLLAVSIASRIRSRGIEARRFLESEQDVIAGACARSIGEALSAGFGR